MIAEADAIAEWLGVGGEESASALIDPATVPTQFVEFCEWIGIALYPGQRVLSKVAFDGWEPRDLDDETPCEEDLEQRTERQIAREIFGDLETIPKLARSELCAVCGARGGKTFILGAARTLHQALTFPGISQLGPGEHAFALIIGPHLRHAEQCFRFVTGLVQEREEIRRAVQRVGVKNGCPSLTISRTDGPVTIESRPASSGGLGGRGFTLISAVIDEGAFFYDSTHKVSDKDVHGALATRILHPGQLVMCSTPWMEAGLLHEMFEANFGAPKTAIAAHAPTLLLNPSKKNEVAREEINDPPRYQRENLAMFMTAGTEAVFDGRSIKACIREELQMPRQPELDSIVMVGADFGFRTDSSALVGVELTTNGAFRVLCVSEIQPASAPLKPSKVVSDFAAQMGMIGADTLIADGHYRESVTEHLEDNELYFQPAPGGGDGKANAYTVVKGLLLEERLELPNHPRLLKQMREVMKKPLPGGGVRIDSPRWRSGGHGDLVTALVWAVHAASKHDIPEQNRRAIPGTPDAERQRMRERWERKIEQYNRETEESPYEQDNDWILGPNL